MSAGLSSVTPMRAEAHDHEEHLVDALVDHVLGRLERLGLDLERFGLGYVIVELGLDLLAGGVAGLRQQLARAGPRPVSDCLRMSATVVMYRW